MGTRQTQ
jgi:hypothetical protein